MKGILRRKGTKWVVSIFVLGSNHTEEYELHPYSINNVPYLITTWNENETEVEFEIVEEVIDLGRHGSTIGKYAKLIQYKEEPPYPSQFYEYGQKLGININDLQRLMVLSQPKDKSESWNNILDEFTKFGKGKIGDWLKENFEVPKRLKK